MERHDCEGWLFIDVDTDSPEMKVRLRHSEQHTPYVDIEIPLKWREFILAHLDWTPGKVRCLFIDAVSRYRVAPFYSIPGVTDQPEDQVAPHAWLERMSIPTPVTPPRQRRSPSTAPTQVRHFQR